MGDELPLPLWPRPELLVPRPAERPRRHAHGGAVGPRKSGKPMARLSPIGALTPTKLGLLNGKIKVPDDFNESLDEEVIAEFEGR